MLVLQNNLENREECLMGMLVIEKFQPVVFNERLNIIKQEIRDSIKKKFNSIDRKALKSVHPLDVYCSYYKKYGYTYHLLLQLESLLQGKLRPAVSPLVEIMFIAEMKNLLLTAGHDLEKIEFPLGLKRSDGESYTALNGSQVISVAGDFMMADAGGIISSILKGPDARTGITDDTDRVLFTVYAPNGIEESLIEQHLVDIESWVKLSSKSPSIFTAHRAVNI